MKFEQAVCLAKDESGLDSFYISLINILLCQKQVLE